MEALENASQTQAFPSPSVNDDPMSFPARRIPPNMAPGNSPQESPCAGGHDGVSSSSQGHILLATFPYMMAGLAAMILVLLLSLVLLVCCYLRILSNVGTSRLQGRQSRHDVATAAASAWNSWNSQARAQAEAQAPTAQGPIPRPDQQDDSWSKVVVVMAGDVMPTFLALPCEYAQRTSAAPPQQSEGVT